MNRCRDALQLQRTLYLTEGREPAQCRRLILPARARMPLHAGLASLTVIRTDTPLVASFNSLQQSSSSLWSPFGGTSTGCCSRRSCRCVSAMIQSSSTRQYGSSARAHVEVRHRVCTRVRMWGCTYWRVCLHGPSWPTIILRKALRTHIHIVVIFRTSTHHPYLLTHAVRHRGPLLPYCSWSGRLRTRPRRTLSSRHGSTRSGSRMS